MSAIINGVMFEKRGMLGSLNKPDILKSSESCDRETRIKHNFKYMIFREGHRMRNKVREDQR